MAVVHTEKETLIISAKSSAMKPIVWKANQQKNCTDSSAEKGQRTYTFKSKLNEMKYQVFETRKLVDFSVSDS